MEPPSAPLVDAAVPSAPRVYDYWLGGKDNFEADRQLADLLDAESGGVARELARVNRRFVLRAVTWTASMCGTGQFLDLGCGLPARPAVHDAARDGCEGARVVYVDNDPVVMSHVAALQAGAGLGAVLADVSDPAAALAAITGLGIVDFARPACAVFGGTLSAMGAETARGAVAAFAAAMVPGSAVVISCASYRDEALAARMSGEWSPAGHWVSHTAEDVTGFFTAAGLRIVRGRIGDVSHWPMLSACEQSASSVVGGVGIKD